ncbi:MAG: SusC/RagA family TonB-linked outer membrane protein [Daejeonella sp.]
MNKLYYIFFLLCIPFCAWSQSSSILRGRVLSDHNGAALAGASVRLKGSNAGASTDAEGHFSMRITGEQATLSISYLSYLSREVTVDLPVDEVMDIRLSEDARSLGEVVVSTGYQEIPRERATGSFVQAGQSLLNQRLSTDILSRLENTVTGLVFNRKGLSSISIRGQSTIFANAQPLIVLDNFPYDGDMNNINPNDVESITVLKDAAAASIWGARAGNGVIVITTKKGRLNQPLQVAYNTGLTVGDKPDLFYQPKMSSAEYIAIEQRLFDQGFYRSAELSAARTPLSPVVELLIAKRDGKLSATETVSRLEALKLRDVRNDLERYVQQNSINQQHALTFNGGSENQRYYFSTGYDNNLENLKENSYRRYSLNASSTYFALKKRLEIVTGVSLLQSLNRRNNTGTSIQLATVGNTELYPYARLADDQGRTLGIVKDYRETYTAQAAGQGLLDWQYRPIEEITLADNLAKHDEYRLHLGLKYQLLKGLKGEVFYQYNNNKGNGTELHNTGSYFTRDLINKFTQTNADGSLNRVIPVGSIRDRTNSSLESRNARGQLVYSGNWRQKHEITALAGVEKRNTRSVSLSTRTYGYDQEHGVSAGIDYVTRYRQYQNQNSLAAIPFTDQESDLSDRFLSWYSNASYEYDRRYILSVSARIDQSNLFGVKTNQKGVPLYSLGLAWNIHNESFYNYSLFPYLKLRATYGYNGNVDKSLSAYTTARYLPGTVSISGLPYAQVFSPPNPLLRWERVKIINLGLDFESAKGLFTGTVEYFHKKGIDLIGDSPFPPSSGITTFRGNNAMMKTTGLDLTLAAHTGGKGLRWNPIFMLSYVKERVTEYLATFSTGSYLLGVNPVVGKPLYSYYSYRWAGLDPQTGDPQGYLAGLPSKDYARIISTATLDDLVFSGPSRPPVFGAIRNTFSWKQVSFSANLGFRVGYYSRRNSVNYATNYGLGTHGDYSNRWQKPGDEQQTHVPSVPVTGDRNRDNLYIYSQELIEKADHLRLQDIQLSYDFSRARLQALPVKYIRIFLYANNIGILWKASKYPGDPEYGNSGSALLPVPRTLAAGFKIDF